MHGTAESVASAFQRRERGVCRASLWAVSPSVAVGTADETLRASTGDSTVKGPGRLGRLALASVRVAQAIW